MSATMSNDFFFVGFFPHDYGGRLDSGRLGLDENVNYEDGSRVAVCASLAIS